MTARGPGRPRESSHERIREAALALFERQGYDATSLAEIAAAAGISRTTLFAYVPAKRDLLWSEHEHRLAAASAVLERDHDDVVGLVIAALLAVARYDATEREALALRWRLARGSDELRAHTALQSERVVDLLTTAAVARAPGVEPDLVEGVVRALVAVATLHVDRWAGSSTATEDLDTYLATRVAPVAQALRPLLP